MAIVIFCDATRPLGPRQVVQLETTQKELALLYGPMLLCFRKRSAHRQTEFVIIRTESVQYVFHSLLAAFAIIVSALSRLFPER
jgi:hypothetical protein